eukprot:15358505-Ditylum_brightwellii.AAC.1
MVCLWGLLTSSSLSTLQASDLGGFCGLKGLEGPSNLLVAHIDYTPLSHREMLHIMMRTLGKVKTNEVGLSLEVEPNEVQENVKMKTPTNIL